MHSMEAQSAAQHSMSWSEETGPAAVCSAKVAKVFWSAASVCSWH